MNNFDDILNEIDDIYDDKVEQSEPQVEPIANSMDATIKHTEAYVDLQIRLAEKIDELRQKQQKKEIELGKQILEFINLSKKNALEEQAEFQKQVNELVINKSPE